MNFLISYRVYMMTESFHLLISRYLKVQFMLIKYTEDSKSQTWRMRYPFQSTGRPISHRNLWSFCSLHDTFTGFRTGEKFSRR